MRFAVAGRHHDDAGGFRRPTDLRGIGRCTNSALINGGGSDRTASGIELPCDPWRLAPPSLSHLDSALWRSWEGSEKLGFSSSIRTLSEYIGEEESSQAGTPRTTEQATPAEVPFSANGGAREEAQTRPLMAALGRFHELASGRKAVLQAHGPKADPLNVAFGSGADGRLGGDSRHYSNRSQDPRLTAPSRRTTSARSAADRSMRAASVYFSRA